MVAAALKSTHLWDAHAKEGRSAASAGAAADDGARPGLMNVFPKPDLTTAATGGRNVVAVLGPTNTGKTHLAIERMLAHSSGVIGLPLRLLAREVYNRVAERVGRDAVALVTGEEKIIPPAARFRVCTVEALPDRTDAAFLAIDEIQLAADLERGHIFTDRILNLRGRDETLLLGAATMRGVVEKLIPGINVVTRPRMSVLAYNGQKKITRLPRRSAVVAFSADEVYAIGELIRRQRGGVAVVLGALSPRTRNAQVELFQNGDVDFLVATDAIGMGLNLDVDHVAFAADRKFDGYQYRRLTPAEFAQIAGRAGRHTRDGTFGVTGRVDPFDDTLVDALESHRFDAIKVVQWRNRQLDFASIAALRASLDRPPDRDGLVRAPPAEDLTALEFAARDPEARRLADRPARVSLLWDVCQIPDYRRIAPANHAELVMALFGYLARDGAIDEDWFAGQIAFADRTDGDIDTLANRIAHIRTWTFAANRPNWLADQAHWQERTRAIEDRLSDALHERLTQRFVDRRTSVLMRRLRENAMLEAEITPAGDVLVEGQHVGQLEGFRFAPDPAAGGEDAKAIRAAAQKALAGEINRRAEGVAAADNSQFILAASDGTLRWQGVAIAKLVEGDDVLVPRLLLLADETLSGPQREAVQNRLDRWLEQHGQTLLKPLFDLRAAEDLAPLARGLAFRLVEGLGVVERAEIADEVKGLDQDMRAGLRKLGVRFGAHHLYVPALLKPAPSGLLAVLWGLKNGGLDQPGIAELPQLSSAGRTTIPVEPTYPRPLYRVVGYRIAGPRAVRLDILERLADLIRPLLAWRPTAETPTPPPGAVLGGGFTVTGAMTSLLGTSGEDFAAILKSLGYRAERRPAPAAPAAPEETAAPEGAAAAEDDAAPAAEAAPEETEAAPVRAEPAAAEAAEAQNLELEKALQALAGNAPAEASSAEAAAVEAAPAEAETVAALEPEAPEPASAPVEDAAAAAEPAEPEITAQAEPIADAKVSGDAEVAAGPEEPAFIEVWRPARNDRRPPRHGQGRRPAADGADAGEPRRGRRDRGEHRGPRQQPGTGVAAGEAGAETPQREGRPRSQESRRPNNRRDDRRGGDRRQEERRGDERQAPARRPEPRDRPIDPNSPFAALAALKAQLEGRKPE